MIKRTSANSESVGSWDFPTTLLASTHKRRFSEEIFTTNDREAEVSPCEQDKRGNNLSSSSGTSNSSIVLNSITTPSTSPPSSYTESMGPSCESRKSYVLSPGQV